jgi:hypothetical protein
MDSLQWNVDTIAHVIDISVAPVFLLAGISGLLMVLTNRLGRTIDRSRSLQATINKTISAQHKTAIEFEMKGLLMRSRFINLAINLATVSALMVCFVIIALFLGSLLTINVGLVVASLFIGCMVILALAFGCFVVEVFIASRSLRVSLVSTETFRESDQE